MSAKPKAKPVSRLILQLWAWQLGLLTLVVISLWWLKPVTAYSVGVGGLIFWLPNAYFTLSVFRYRGAQAAIYMLRNIYRGEAYKIALTATGFALAFVLVKPVDVIALFAAFIALTISQSILVSCWHIE